MTTKTEVRITFTGTKRGMTEHQKTMLRRYLTLGRHKIDAFHHGDCIGADAQAHDIAVDVLGADKVWIHPGCNPKLRAYCKSPHILPAHDDNIERNHEMVDVTVAVIAAPQTKKEVLRSGTWATIRYARKQRRPVKILEP